MVRGTDLQPLTSPLLQKLWDNFNACGAAGFFLLTLPQLEALTGSNAVSGFHRLSQRQLFLGFADVL